MTGGPTQTPESGPEHASRYEALRTYAVGRRAPASRDGLVVLLRQGVAAWMESRSRLPAAPPRLVEAEAQRPSPLPQDANAEVVRVLVAMTLGHILELHA